MIDRARARPDVLAALTLVALTAAQMWPAAGPGRLPQSLDLMLQYVPNAAYLGASLREARLPLWDPYLGTGMPFAADPGSGAWYLPTWPLLAAFSLYAAVRMALWLHVLWAAFGAYFFCRGVVAVRPLAACVGAIAFALTTWLPTLGGMPAVLTSLAWLPWVAALGWLGARNGGRWTAALACAAALQLVSGWPAAAYLAWLTVGTLYAAAAPRLIGVARLLLAGALAALLAGVLVVPAAEFIFQTNYGATRPLESATSEVYLTLLSWLRPASGSGSLESSQLYVGTASLLVALIGAAGWRRPVVRALIVLAALSLALSLGSRTPLFGLFYGGLPGFRIVYLPARLASVTALATAGLGAAGIDRLMTARLPRRAAGAAAITFLALAPLTLLQFWSSEGYDNFRRLLTNVGRLSGGPFLGREDELHYAAFAFLALAALALATRPTWRLAAPLVAAVLIADVLTVRHAEPPPAFDPASWYDPALTAAEQLRQELGHERFAGSQWHGTKHFLTDFPHSAQSALLPPNLALMARVRDAQGYNPLLLRRAADFFAAANARDQGGVRPNEHWLWLDDFHGKDVDELAVRVMLADDAQWRVRGRRVLWPQQLRPGDGGARVSLPLAPSPRGAATLHLVTFLGEATHLPDGVLVGELILAGRDGEQRQPLWVGDHTSEWAYDRPDVKAIVAHRQAPIALDTQLVDAVAGRYRVFEYRAAFPITIAGPLTALQVVPRLPVGTRTTLNVAGAWLEDSADLPQSPTLAGALLNPTASPRARATTGQVTWQRDDPEHLELAVETAAETTVTFADALYPGWIARVDGREVPIRATASLFRAVDVPAGRHMLTLSYQPRSLWLGVAATTIGLALSVWLLRPNASFRQSRRMPSRARQRPQVRA